MKAWGFYIVLVFGLASTAFPRMAQAKKSDPHTLVQCSNINGWGSVIYTETCANGRYVWDGTSSVYQCSNYVTVNTWYAQGASCPGDLSAQQ